MSESRVAVERERSPDGPLDRGAAVAFWVFVGVEIAAVALFLVQGRQHWFYFDEWDFLATRRGTEVADLLRPHVEHWTTVPILTYRGLWTLFGLRSYVPYQLVAIAAHVAVAGLLRGIMRRSHVGPWIATLSASVMALFGSGNENIIWAFQITFTGALAFGLVQLLLADHDGPIRWRDWLGLFSGLLAIMCSGPGLVMVAVVGLATMLRRGWRAAAFQVVPLVAVYGLWSVFYGESTNYEGGGAPSAGALLGFLARGLTATYRALGFYAPAGVLLAGLLILGGVVLARREPRKTLKTEYASPLALLAGSLLFLLVTGFGRVEAYGTGRAHTSRYLYMVAAMTLPALAVAADAVVRRFPKSSIPVVLLLLIGIPGNVAAAGDFDPARRGEEPLVRQLAHQAMSTDAPRSGRPLGFIPELTVGWLADGARDGRIPAPGQADSADEVRAALLLSIGQTTGPAVNGPCAALEAPLVRQMRKGDRLSFRGGGMRLTEASEPSSEGAVLLWPRNGNVVVALATTPDLLLTAVDPNAPPTVCG